MKSFLGRILCRIGIHDWATIGRIGDKKACVCWRCAVSKYRLPPNKDWNEDDGAIF